MHKTLIYILLLAIPFCGSSQNLSNVRTKYINIYNDTIKIDSLSLIPNSEIIINDNSVVSKNHYSINYPDALLILSDSIYFLTKQLKITYRVFPVNFQEESYYRKKEKTIITGPVLAVPKSVSTNLNPNFFTDNHLNKQGSISRGITIGNNQDAVINSNLNIQLTGKLNDKVNILAAISDENIPIQPDGNSQQIQEFDKIFIQLYNEKTKLIAGDFMISKPEGYFLNLNKKAQGGLFSTNISSKKSKDIKITSTVSGAFSKGKYCRKSFQGQEGNQGPYKLTGCENEQFIIVLAGSERVYINGKLKSRGQEYDYTINYNTGEIIFTSNQPINKDSRIAVEFEYSEQSYSRYMLYTANTIKTKKGKIWINAFSEQDSKTQPLNQDLTNEQKEILNKSGDNIENAFAENIDSVGFNSDFVLYEKTDTLVSTVNYTIYKYSTNPQKAFYQIGFSYVGENKGNYIQTQTSANGKVFKWIAPIDNVPQGNYEPIRLLVSPKKIQLFNFGGNLKINEKTRTFFEVAFSNYDINTFSDKDASDNVGYGLKVNAEQKLFAKDTSRNALYTNISYQLLDENFTTPEKFRSVEFDRDWNLHSDLQGNEHLAEIDLNYRHKNNVYTNYGFSYLERTSMYEGYKNRLNISLYKSGYNFGFNSSILNTSSNQYNTQFIRYLANLSKSFQKISLGLENEYENNQWTQQSDSLYLTSFRFSSYKMYVQNSDSTINKYFASYTLRDDYLPYNNNLSHSSKAEDFSIGFGLLKNPNSILRAKVNYRLLNIIDTSIINQADEKTLTGRIDYSFKLFKGTISSFTFYEAGSGLEPKREYSYVKVANGQGIYSWTDYNSNNVAELDEFEIAKFQDEANYIRIYTPSNEYIKSYSNEFSQIFNIRPSSIWRSKNDLRKILSLFSNNFAYSIKQKSTNDDLKKSLNPFYVDNNSKSVINLNQNFRNTFSFNSLKSKLGIDYIYQNNHNNILLSNGLDERRKELNSLRIRWNIFSGFTILNSTEKGTKTYISQYFSSKNYFISNTLNEVKFQYQPGFVAKAELNYSYNCKDNQEATEKAIIHKVGTEINYSFKSKANLLLQGNYFNIAYNSEINTSVAYEMLEGLKPGNNGTWSVIFQQKIAKNIEFNLNYTGRISENIKAIHTGSMQVRAFF